MVSSDEGVPRVFGVLVHYHVSPGEHSHGVLSDTGVDRSSIASIPNNESIVGSNTSQEALIS